MSPEDVRAAVLRRWPGFRGSYADLDEWLGLVEGTTERIVTENRKAT